MKISIKYKLQFFKLHLLIFILVSELLNNCSLGKLPGGVEKNLRAIGDNILNSSR